MKILLQNSVFFPRVIGGAEISTHLLELELRKRGIDVDVVATTGKHGRKRTLASRPSTDGLGTIYEAPAHGLCDLYVDGGRPPQAGLLLRALHHLTSWNSPRWGRLFGKVLAEVRPDVVHTNTIVGMTPSIWAIAHAKGIPVVHTLRDYHLLCPRTTLLRSDSSECRHPPLPCRFLSGLKLNRADHVAVVTAPSRFVLERHRASGGFPSSRGEIVPNACGEIPPEVPDRSRRTRLSGLYLGQMDTHKGIPQLLAALDELFGMTPYANCGFNFAGEGPLADEVQAFCARHPGRARYHGFVEGEAKQTLLREAAWLVQPAVWNEIFGRTLLDACSWGLPVIAARRGGIPEVIRDGQEGLLVEPRPTDLLLAMQRYHDEPDLRLEHGRAARKRALDFTLERQIDRFEAIYHSLLETD